ncbi:hypothetical protein GCM10009557_65990 [Virgisporangium ochraceum]
MPSTSSAQVDWAPAVTAVSLFPDSTPAVSTATGTGEFTAPPPSPSWPWLSAPQQYTAPSSSSAQTCEVPTATSTTALPVSAPPVTGTGTSESVPAALLPSCPAELDPQHDTCRTVSTTHVVSPPAPSRATVPLVSDPPSTMRAVAPVVGAVPVPSCPLALAPQHQTVPDGRTLHPCPVPPTIWPSSTASAWTADAGAPGTTTGEAARSATTTARNTSLTLRKLLIACGGFGLTG